MMGIYVFESFVFSTITGMYASSNCASCIPYHTRLLFFYFDLKCILKRFLWVKCFIEAGMTVMEGKKLRNKKLCMKTIDDFCSFFAKMTSAKISKNEYWENKLQRWTKKAGVSLLSARLKTISTVWLLTLLIIGING